MAAPDKLGHTRDHWISVICSGCRPVTTGQAFLGANNVGICAQLKLKRLPYHCEYFPLLSDIEDLVVTDYTCIQKGYLNLHLIWKITYLAIGKEEPSSFPFHYETANI